jgi:hypothetical protein
VVLCLSATIEAQAWTHPGIVVSPDQLVQLDIPAQTYNVYVTPEGGSQAQIGANYAFRLSAPTISNVTYHAEVGSDNVCSFNLPLGGN